ncbi:xylulokinase [Anopheles sinensis]|uniref:Xylulokinase n=1 Tax=Anopheles sinensis TaxID=74873 RepID=A0A084VVQ5_ANOSI|nr:xylulokinase [Anopheles sinensis]
MSDVLAIAARARFVSGASATAESGTHKWPPEGEFPAFSPFHFNSTKIRTRTEHKMDKAAAAAAGCLPAALS